MFTHLKVKTVLYQTIQFSESRVSMSKTVPFQTIQLSNNTQFEYKYTVLLSKTFLFQAIQFSQTVLVQRIQFSISMQLVLVNTEIRPYQALPFWSRIDLGAMAMKRCSGFPKAPALLEPHHSQCYTLCVDRHKI